MTRPGRALDWVVVGAGLSGATIAERLASQLGQRVLVVERRDHIAGNAHDTEDRSGIRVHRYGAHIFHTKSDEVWGYLSRFTDWLPYLHRVRAFVDGQLLPMPCNLSTLEQLLGPRAIAELEAIASGAFPGQPKVPVLTLMAHPEAAVRGVGEVVYEKLFLRYTLKQWGWRPEDLDRSVTARVPVLFSRDDRYFADSHQGIPSDGYTAMVARMLEHPNISVEICRDHRTLSDTLRALPTVYTGPVDEFFAHRFGPLPYRSLRFEHQTLAVDRAQPVAVVNYPGNEPYTRVIEHAHFADQHRGATVLTYEFPEPHVPGANEPYYPVPRSENHRLYARYAAEAKRLTGRVLFVGRLAEYRYYDMDQAVAHALALFNHNLGAGRARQRRTLSPARSRQPAHLPSFA
ncbi:MAG: UDP-galactopyranose mutase [Acidimicrobiales bacterium]